MQTEYNALVHNHTWTLVPPACSHNVVDCKWVFKIKYKSDGSVDRYKARLVAKGFTQRPGLDYHSTYSPVIKPTTVRLVLTIAVQKNWHVHQLDVNNAFLQGRLEEEVFMKQPPGFTDPQHPTYICKLSRAIYGLRQASRTWYNELKVFLLQIGFKKSLSDPSLFILHSDTITAYVLVYVDDILVTGCTQLIIQKIIQALASRFSLKDLGRLNFFLGVEFLPHPDGIVLSQSKYISDLLHDTNMHDSNGVATPMCSTSPLLVIQGEPPLDVTEYRKILGKLQYLSFTRPDLSFAVNKLSQFMHHPQRAHWQAVKRLLRYLKSTSTHGLLISRHSGPSLRVYSDSDWAGNLTDRTSTTGYIVYYGTTPISWSSKKQKTVARSSTEAEYRAVATALAESNWITNLLSELRVSLPDKPQILCDNVGATYLCQNPVFHSRMKHIAIDFHFVREQVERKMVEVRHVPSSDQVADSLTKPLPKSLFKSQFSKIAIIDTMSFLRGRNKT